MEKDPQSKVGESKKDQPGFFRKLFTPLRGLFTLSDEQRAYYIQEGAYFGNLAWQSPGTMAVRYSKLPPRMSIDDLSDVQLRVALDFGVVHHAVVTPARLLAARAIQEEVAANAAVPFFDYIDEQRWFDDPPRRSGRKA